MSIQKPTDYLKFDASDIQELLRRKLLEADILTDQLYPGSDTKIVIDLFAWTFDVLTYMLNNAASDSLFSDTYLYENMNRLVKLLSYNPIGYRTAQCQFQISVNNAGSVGILPDVINIPRFASLNLGSKDMHGNDIAYTFLEPFSISVESYIDNNNIIANVITPSNWPTLYNGNIKKYDTTFFANEVANEIIVLTDINPNNTTSPIFCDFNSIFVFVETTDSSTGETVYTEWTRIKNLTLNAGPTDTYYEVRLNEDKRYEIKFGNNIHGKMPEYGAGIHVLYLQSNGEEGKLDAHEVSLSELKLSIDGFSDINQMINMLYGNFESFKKNYSSLFINNSIFSNTSEKLTFSNINISSDPKDFETIEEIKENAPVAFRSGERLITGYDYEQFILSEYSNIVKHVYVNNNNYYISTFYRWLNKYDALNINIRRYYYKFANTCDFNNVYIWMKSQNEISQLNMQKIINGCNPYKSLTSELTPLQAIDTYLVPFIQHNTEEYKLNIDNILQDIDAYLNQIKIIIYKNSSSIISNDQLKEKINNIILNYFNINNQKFGSVINLADITNEIYNLGYIKSIRTVNIPEEDKNNINYVVGLSFAAFTPKFIEGKDFTEFTGNLTLENFQFPSLYVKTLLNMIEIKEDIYTLTNNEF